MRRFWTALFLIVVGGAAHADFESRWHEASDRPWIGPELFANRLQDWCVRDGRLCCEEYAAKRPFRTVSLLTQRIDTTRGSFTSRFTVVWDELSGSQDTSARVGLLLGVGGPDIDHRLSALVHHRPAEDGGLLLLIDDRGRIELRDFSQGGGGGLWSMGGEVDPAAMPLISSPVAEGPFRLNPVSRIEVTVSWAGGKLLVSTDAGGPEYSLDSFLLDGALALVATGGEGEVRGVAFDSWSVSGDAVVDHPDRAFGPILSTMYTVQGRELRLTAQLPPIGAEDRQSATLELQVDGEWHVMTGGKVVADSFTVPFTTVLPPGEPSFPYRVRYAGTTYEGTVHLEPQPMRELVVAAFTGHKCYTGGLRWNHDGLWFPHADLVDHVAAHEPDVLFFSGDQVYEGDLTPAHVRPVEKAILDYHYRWQRWCWAFRDLTRHRPTVCIPDDHDVYHGNLWGAGGKKALAKDGLTAQDSGGYRQPPRFVNMVHRTQTSHLPPPVDPTPCEQGICVYTTSFEWSGLSFGIIADRQWKSSPSVAVPEGKVVNGWFQNPDFDPARDADVEGAVLLGERQLAFLEDWATDFSNCWAKVLLSQTIFANVATIPETATSGSVLPSLPIPAPGEYPEGYKLAADADSNGWPQTGRNEALRRIRKGAAVHLAGDQHLGSTIRYGIDTHGDAGYALCVPSIANTWPRRWFPPLAGKNREEGAPRYTGDFHDGFGNPMTVLAVSNPMDYGVEPRRLHDAAPGYGIARFDPLTREVTLENWPRWVDPRAEDASPYPGWPVRFPYAAGDGREPAAWLPTIRVADEFFPTIRVIDETTGELLYARRGYPVNRLPVFATDHTYTIEVGRPGTGATKRLTGIVPGDGSILVTRD